MTKEKYFKTFGHFNVSEWLLLGVKAGLELSQLQSFSSKNQLINYIGSSCPSYFNDLSLPYYFKMTEKNDKKQLSIITDEPLDINAYVEKKNSRWVLSDEEIKQIIGKTSDDLVETTLELESLHIIFADV